ncbi:MAG: hypothetical protein AAFR17_11990 [Pseudomonadota bacterium]
MGIARIIGGVFLVLVGLAGCAPAPVGPLALPAGYTPVLRSDQAPMVLVETVTQRLDRGCWFGGPHAYYTEVEERGERDLLTRIRLLRPGARSATEFLVLGRRKAPGSGGVTTGELASGRLPPPAPVTAWTTHLGLSPTVASAVAEQIRTDIIATRYGFDRCTSLTAAIG